MLIASGVRSPDVCEIWVDKHYKYLNYVIVHEYLINAIGLLLNNHLLVVLKLECINPLTVGGDYVLWPTATHGHSVLYPFSEN